MTDTKEKPFGCSICSKAFTRKDLLKRHHGIYHGEKIVQRAEADMLQASSCTALSSTKVLTANIKGLVPVRNPEANGFPLTRERHATFVAGSAPVVTFGSIQDDRTLEAAGIWAPELGHNEFSNSYVGDDFSNFVDSIGFPSNVFSPSYQPVPDWPSEPPFAWQLETSEPHRANRNGMEAEPEDLDVESTPWASRLPSVQPQDQQRHFTKSPRRAAPQALAQVTHECRERMVQKLDAYSSVLPADFTLPSRHTLTGFVTGYITVFNGHYPLLHLPTLKLESLSVELFLSIAALGAQYYWERAKGFELFHLARTIAYDRLRGQAAQRPLPQFDNGGLLQLAQALILLIAVSTWSETGKGEAFSLRSLLEEVLQADALDLKNSTDEVSWLDWKHYEEVKRTKLIAYAFFNLHTITFDVPPMMLYRDIDVNLASSEKLWGADNFDQWRQLREEEAAEVSFKAAFHALFGEDPDETIPYISPLSGHVLMHAIIQHMWLLQQAENLPIRQSIASTAAAASIELALKRWGKCCEPGPRSGPNTSDSDGPMPFTSRALLRLAYIRLNIDSGSARSIGSWDPEKIAKSLRRQASVERSQRMTRAALHCAQGLGIPIKLGINFVAHTQVFYWSNQYALCSLECALLLTKWLEAVTVSRPHPHLDDRENKLLDFVVQLVNHTEYEAPRQRLLQSSKTLSVIILRLWAKLFRPDSVWSIVDLIGKSLQAYANLLERDVEQEARSSTAT